LSQTFTASAGQTLRFTYFWDAGDVLGTGNQYNDWAKATISLNSGSSVVIVSKDVASNPDDTSWVPYSYNLSSGGTYTLSFQVANVTDGAYPSFLGVDAVSVVPVPAGVLLGFLGLTVAGVKLRRYV
jgi:hypothetical protein